MTSVPQSGGDGPMERQSHDEQQAAEAFRVVDVGLLDTEAAPKPRDLKSENMGSRWLFKHLEVRCSTSSQRTSSRAGG
jgi:hypothetical protein